MHIGAEDDNSRCTSQDIAENELDRMRIVGRDADGGLVLVVLLMNVWVDGLPVEEAMGHMEEEIFTHHTEDDLADKDKPVRDSLLAHIEVERDPEDFIVTEGEGSDDQHVDDVDSN